MDPVEGGSANDYDYAEGDPINNFDLTGEYCLTGKNPNGTCRSISRGAGRNVRGAARGAVKVAKGAPSFVGRNVVRPFIAYQAGLLVFIVSSNIGFFAGAAIGNVPGAIIGIVIGGGVGLYGGRKASQWTDDQLKKIPGFR